MELLDLAQRVIGWASGDEQVEAYVAHSRDTEVEVYQADIETLSTAETDGVGIRVVLPSADGARQGFAYTGSLDEAGSFSSASFTPSKKSALCAGRAPRALSR